VAILKVAVFCALWQCILVEICRCFRFACCLHYQDGKFISFKSRMPSVHLETRSSTNTDFFLSSQNMNFLSVLVTFPTLFTNWYDNLIKILILLSHSLDSIYLVTSDGSFV
jgi:hypothetical protein